LRSAEMNMEQRLM